MARRRYETQETRRREDEFAERAGELLGWILIRRSKEEDSLEEIDYDVFDAKDGRKLGIAEVKIRWRTFDSYDTVFMPKSKYEAGMKVVEFEGGTFWFLVGLIDVSSRAVITRRNYTVHDGARTVQARDDYDSKEPVIDVPMNDFEVFEQKTYPKP